MKNQLFFVFLISSLLLVSCSNGQKEIQTALDKINADGLKEKISILASDDFRGRAPATLGEERTINYLQEQFKKIGLRPGNGNSYLQEIPLVEITTNQNSVTAVVKDKKETINLSVSKDFVVGTTRFVDNTSLKNSEMIFAGYGIVAPEYNWNDYRGLDVKGKTVVVLVNDPGFATGDKNLFNGKAMTYYGRWTYKYEEAARQGAAGLIIIHETDAAGYPWGVVENSWTGTRFYLDSPDKNMSNCEFNGWVTTETAQKIFEMSGLDYNKEIVSASQRGFKPVVLSSKMSISFKSKFAYIKSNNVIGILPGKELADEYIIYTAHWDHFGVKPNPAQGDSILNGAVDNATGVAGILEIAEAFASLRQPQKRSIVFLSVTCEEAGLLGSDYYAKHPLVPLKKTAAEINLDALNVFGKTNDITLAGFKDSELDDYAEKVIKENERYVVPEPTPEKGMYFRSDHFSFAKVGVPVLYFGSGMDNIEHGKQWGLDQSAKWLRENYHKPSDEYKPDIWKFDGMLADLKIIFEVGYDLSMTNKFPNWLAGSPFKANRDAMMK
ncbi:MAG: M28 family metallopeptidase [Ignavibacteriales bacterium]|nr:M28 family metallopeptidase [Ignavibacteriales bacterium]